MPSDGRRFWRLIAGICLVKLLTQELGCRPQATCGSFRLHASGTGSAPSYTNGSGRQKARVVASRGGDATGERGLAALPGIAELPWRHGSIPLPAARNAGTMRSCVVLVVLALRCSKPSGVSRDADAVPPAAATATAPPISAPDAPSGPDTAPRPPASAPAVLVASASDPCSVIAEKFDAALSAANGHCTSDADCACYSDLRFDGSMHVSDRATSAKLDAYTRDYRRRSCPDICVQTGPSYHCTPRCETGTCR